MGNVDTRAKFDAGYIVVQTDKPFYSPGELLTGKIYLRIFKPYDAKVMELQVKGKEKGSWIEQEGRWVQNPDGTQRHEFYDVKRKGVRDIIEATVPVYQFPPQGVIPGDFILPFQFQLPAGLPSSMLYNNKHHVKKPKAKIKYHLKAKIQTKSDHNEMFFKQILIIKEHPPSLQENISRISENAITTGCFQNQGVSKIEVKFDKNTFEPHENARCSAIVDNSKCNTNMTNITLGVEQEIHIKDHEGRSFSETVTLVESVQDGVPGRHPSPVDKFVTVDLGKIKYNPPQTHKKKGVMKNVSIEDQFMMSMAQPASHGHVLKNEYFIAFRTQFEGCVCSQMPSAKVPLVIVPVVNPHCFYQVPHDFKPQSFQMAQIQINVPPAQIKAAKVQVQVPGAQVSVNGHGGQVNTGMQVSVGGQHQDQFHTGVQVHVSGQQHSQVNVQINGQDNHYQQIHH